MRSEREVLRDQFAMAALQGFCANPDFSQSDPDAVAAMSWDQADAMLDALEPASELKPLVGGQVSVELGGDDGTP